MSRVVVVADFFRANRLELVSGFLLVPPGFSLLAHISCLSTSHSRCQMVETEHAITGSTSTCMHALRRLTLTDTAHARPFGLWANQRLRIACSENVRNLRNNPQQNPRRARTLDHTKPATRTDLFGPTLTESGNASPSSEEQSRTPGSGTASSYRSLNDPSSGMHDPSSDLRREQLLLRAAGPCWPCWPWKLYRSPVLRACHDRRMIYETSGQILFSWSALTSS